MTSFQSRFRVVSTFFLLWTTLSLPALAASCDSQEYCAETNSFVATVTSFRESKIGRTRVLSASLRFQNKLNRPLILGYVANSGVGTDQHGNRYVVYGSNSVRGIGEIVRNTFDSRFTLASGGSGDARFELQWKPTGREIYGDQFVLEVSVREIDPVAPNQYRMGAEHPLQFTGLVDGLAAKTLPTTSRSAVTGSDSSTEMNSSASVVAAEPNQDQCAKKTQCFDAGPFYAEILNLNGSFYGNRKHHILRLNVRFTNTSSEPLILGYTAKSSAIVDNLGNRYFWGRAGTYDTSVSGMGVVSASKANSSFVLQPGASRNATFTLTRYNVGRNPIGTSFTWDVAVVQVELLSAEQVRSVREFAMNFSELSGNFAASGGAENLNDAVKQLKGLFGKKK